MKLPGSERPIFRPATLSDAANVSAVYLASRKAFLAFAPPAHTDEEIRRWIAGVLIPSGGVTVACVANEPVGMMAVSHDGKAGWIHQLYIHPSAVGCGIGSRMLALAMEKLGPVIRLYTFQANGGSRRFYERHGFRAVAFGDGSSNEEKCPDVLYEFNRTAQPAGGS